MRANFQAIAAAFATNHVPLTQDDEINGMHDELTLRPQTIDPTTSATQTAIYNKLVSSIPALFFRPNSDQTPIQMTYPSIKSDSSGTQYSFVAGPFIIYGGLLTGPANGAVITLSPGTTLLYVDLTATAANVIASGWATPSNITGTSFKVNQPGGAGTQNVYYFAVGI
jgi:hypothetical protein